MATTEAIIRVLYGRNKREVRLHIRKDEHLHEWVLCALPILNNWTMRSPKLASCMLYANIIIPNSKVGCLINNWL